MAIYICYLLLAGIQVPFFYYRRLDALSPRHFDSQKYLTLCCIELILLAGFRGYTVGADTGTYLAAIDYYDNLPVSELLRAKLVWPFDFEIGYFVLTKLSVLFGLGKTGFLFVVALIIYVPIFVSIKKYSLMPYISILCYFAFGMFSYSLGLFRQMIAMSILFCGWRYVVERRFVKYMLIVGLAMLFHTTAVVAVALYFLYGIKWERIIIFLPIAEIGLLVLGRPVVMFAMRLLPKYAGYVDGKYDLQGGSYTMLLLLNIILFASVVFRKKGDCQQNVAICAVTLAVCLQCIGYSMAIFGRVVPYFSIYVIFAIPNIIRGSGEVWRALAPVTGVCLFILVFINLHGNQYVTPYYTIFNGLPN